MNTSLRRQLLILLLSTGSLAWLIISAKSYYDVQEETTKLFDAQLAQSAKALLALTAHELPEHIAFLAQEGKLEDVPEEIAETGHTYEQKIAFQVWFANEKLVVRSNNAPRERLTDQQDTFTDRLIDGKPWRVYAIWDTNKQIQVQVGEDHERRLQIGNEIARHIVTSILITLPLIALIVWFSVGKAMSPLLKLANDVSRREFDNLQPVSTKEVPNEALPLINALNGLFSRLQQAFDNIRSFTADAAHELRTPLSGLKTHAQLALQTEDPEVMKESVRHLLEGTERASHLVEQMLTLARLDPESSVIKTERFDICQLTQEEVALLGNRAVEKNIELSMDSPTSVWINGKAALLAVLVRNLVANAINYTPINGTVNVSINTSTEGVEISVSDSGPGIPQNERDQVFKRFYRGKHITERGTGLGLSIVERILELHHGDIHLDDSDLGGLLVQVSLHNEPQKVYASNISADRKAS